MKTTSSKTISNYKCKHFPLPKCNEYYNIDAFLSFMEYGYSINEIDKDEYICLHYASMICSLPLVHYLVEKDANIEAKTQNQFTLLHFACSKGFLPIVEYLIEKGTDIEAKNNIMLVFMVIFQLFNILLKKVLILKQKIINKSLLLIMHHNMVKLILSNSLFPKELRKTSVHLDDLFGAFLEIL